MKGLTPSASFVWQLRNESAWVAAQAYAMRRWVNARVGILELVILQPHSGAMQPVGAPIRVTPRDHLGLDKNVFFS